jgi:hypothetical protein
MFRRRQVKNHRTLMRDELGESFDHFRMAVIHAKDGTASHMGPRISATRQSVAPTLRKASGATVASVGPLALAARKSAKSGVRQAERAARTGRAKLMREEPRVRRWPKIMGGLLVAGAAVGAAGALVARRRANRSRWEEYGTARSTTSNAGTSFGSSAKQTVETGKQKVQSLADSAKERAADMMHTGARPTETATKPEFGSREDLYGKAGSNPNNSRP